ncbi:MAG: tripartite tricarboxylate transporter substrate binding protein [Proteobacteria bacterium]|nr:tripartite tricarboxylate transporter substrate binding protein [Pseudomonadota bacterium]
MTRFRLRSSFCIFIAAAFCGVLISAGTALPGEYPEKGVKLIVPWKAGGGTDALMRLVAHYATKHLGQPMVVVNVGGVGGTLGARQGKDAKPDGYTLTATHESVISSYIVGVAEFNYSDFIPIANMTSTPAMLAARADAPWKDLRDLIADAKKRPGEITFGATLGSTSHFFPLEIASKAGIQFKVVGYEGTADRQAALLGGFIDLGESNPAAGKKYFQAKKLKGLAIATPKRHPLHPNVPTMKEQGVDIQFAVNRGVCAPLKTPKPVIDKLAEVFKKASEDPEFVKKIDGLGSLVVYLSPSEYKAYIDDATNTWSQLAKEIGLGKKKK